MKDDAKFLLTLFLVLTVFIVVSWYLAKKAVESLLPDTSAIQTLSDFWQHWNGNNTASDAEAAGVAFNAIASAPGSAGARAAEFIPAGELAQPE